MTRIDRVLAVLALGIASCIATAAIAGDGRFEINQACVATGCFPGDTAGFPVSTAADASYVLTSSLSVPDANTTGIMLGLRSSLDLNGFTISGPATCTGQPVSCTGTGSGKGVIGNGGRIHGGTIRGMGSHGIQGGNDTRVESVVIEGNGGDGIQGGLGSYGWHVERCSINSNVGDGIDLNLGGGGSIVIRGNSLRWNGGYGAIGLNMVVTENSVLGNANLGVAASSGGYGQNVINDNNNGGSQAGGAQIGTNVCQDDTTCP